MSPNPNLNFATEYWIDAWQRSILTLDMLRERGNICLEHNAQNAPNVLSFAFEPVRDGRTLPRPVNYVLVRILPPAVPARTDHRGLVRTRSGARRRGRSAPSRGRGQAGHRHQLPSRLGGHD